MVCFGESFELDCESIISLLESAYKEAETTDDTVKEIFSLSSLSACYSAEMMTVLSHISEDAYKSILRLFCKSMILKSVWIRADWIRK